MGARERTGQTGKRQPYRCFLVRCRLEEGAGPEGAAAWRFTVQQAEANAPRRTFVSLPEVAAHLEAELASCALSSQALNAGALGADALGADALGADAPSEVSQEPIRSHPEEIP